jgi:hypothetical protein
MDATGCTGLPRRAPGPDRRRATQQTLCSDCHGDLIDAHPGKTTLANATDFGTDHPQLKAAVIVDPASRAGAARGPAVAEGAQGPAFPAERSGLKFPHDIHLAKACEKPPSLNPPCWPTGRRRRPTPAPCWTRS